MARISQLGVLGIPGPYYGTIADKAEGAAPVSVPRTEPRGGGSAGGPRRRGGQFGGKRQGFDWAARDNTVIPRSRGDGPPEDSPRFKTATVVDLATGEVVEIPAATEPKPPRKVKRRKPAPLVAAAPIAEAVPQDTLDDLASLRRTLVANQERQEKQRRAAAQARRAQEEQAEQARREAEAAARLQMAARSTAEKMAAQAALAAQRREEEEFMIQVVLREIAS